MINNTKKLLELIPSDNLHYDEEFGWGVFSEEELTEIVKNCLHAGVEEEDIYLYVLEEAYARFSDLLIDRVNEGKITFVFDEETEELKDFKPVKEDE